jgi:hypothetical protein
MTSNPGFPWRMLYEYEALGKKNSAYILPTILGERETKACHFFKVQRFLVTIMNLSFAFVALVVSIVSHVAMMVDAQVS